jgi:peptide chain release factor 2
MHNPNIAYISIHAGTGGDDAKDWANMLRRMYIRYGEKKEWRIREINDDTIQLKGKDAYTLLNDESGVHRLVRISPFDAKKLRHTSFALVEVLPELEAVDAEKLSIPESDLKFDFFRASGAGGQNVNKVETAVRVTHLPTGLRAASQIERSQHMNRDHALRLLKAKLTKLMESKHEQEVSNLKTKAEPDWGHEIRSYVLHPYKQVKDHATKKKITQVEEVLDGNLDLLMKIKEQ